MLTVNIRSAWRINGEGSISHFRVSPSIREWLSSRVGGEDFVEDSVPGAALGVGAGGCAQDGKRGGVGQDFGDGGGEVFVAGDAAGHGVGGGGLGGTAFFAAERREQGRWRWCESGCRLEDVGGASVWGDDGGDAAGEGFEDYVAEGVRVGREDEEVHVGVSGGEGIVAEDAGEIGVRQRGAEMRFFGAVADDVPARRDAEGSEQGIDVGEERYVLFYGEAAYIA